MSRSYAYHCIMCVTNSGITCYIKCMHGSLPSQCNQIHAAQTYLKQET
jgi:hypothetical protein